MMFLLVRDLTLEGIPVLVSYRVLKFSRQAYYAWAKSPVSDRDWDDAHAINLVHDIHAADPAFGYRLIRDELKKPVCGRVRTECIGSAGRTRCILLFISGARDRGRKKIGAAR